MSVSSTRPQPDTFTPTRRQRLLLGAIAVVISSVSGLLIGEVAVRLFHPHPMRTPMFDRLNGLRSNLPDTRARVYTPGAFDTIQTFGPQRFRGSKRYAPQPAPGTIRIAAIGDSFTAGDGANDDESYPFVLERLLDDRGWSTEVINAGVGATGTGEQAIYFDEYVSRFHPNVVILGVVANDPDDDANTGLFRREGGGALVPVPAAERPAGRLWPLSRAIHRFPPISWLFGHSELLSLAVYVFHNGTLRHSGGSDAITASHYDEAHLQNTQDEIAWLAKRVNAAGAQLVVIYLPASVSTYEWTGPPYEDWRREEADLADAAARASMESRAAFLDLRPYMRQVYAASHKPLYHHGLDEHPNAAGYNAFARATADFLVRSGVLTAAKPH